MADGIVISNLTVPAIKGDKGDKGDAGKIVGLTITMLDSTATPTVTNTGTQSEANYTIGIPRGTGISTAVINEDGELVITLTDETELNLGVIMPNSVASVSMNEDFDFIVTLTDGTETTVGNLAEEMEDVIETALADYYDKDTSDGKFALITETGNKIDLSINNTTYVITLQLKDKNNNVLSTGTVDLPLESVVVSGRYDNTTKKVILTLQNGNTIEFSVADLVAGLVSESTFNSAINQINASMPRKLSELTNDTGFIRASDYADVYGSRGGTIKVSDRFATSMFSNGELVANTMTYEDYLESTAMAFVSTGTLQTVLGEELGYLEGRINENASSINDLYEQIGDIDTALDLINGEVVS